jgi:cell division protein FtsW
LPVVKVSRLLKEVRERPHHRPDYLFGLLVLLLVGIGMIVIYSTGSIVNFNITGGASDRNSFFQKQLVSVVLGVVFWVIASRIHYSHWRKWALPMLIVSFVLMLLVFVPGLSANVNGASRWIKLGTLSFQPAEFLKLSLVFYLAAWLEDRRDSLRSLTKGLLPFLAVLGITLVLVVVLQRDLGTGIVIISIALSILLVSDAPLWIFGAGLASMIGAAILTIVMFPYRLARLSTFINHKDDVTGADYHINQALIALGSGGLIGRGLGNSLQSYGYLPEATNDSVYAIIGEQFGLWGTMGVVAIFSLIGWRGFRIAKMAPDRFSRMVAVGLTVWLLTQAFVNISAMLSIIPLTGIPLPFISYGGTSLIATMIGVGVLQNISRYTEREQSYADSRIGRRDRRSRHTGFGPVRGAQKTF